MHGFFYHGGVMFMKPSTKIAKIHGLWVRLLDFGAGPTRMPQLTMTNVEK